MTSAVSKPGWFPEGGPVDRVDKAISGLVFRLELGKIFEIVLSVPGMWFGVPLYALALMPTFSALLACHEDAMISFHNLAFDAVLWYAAIPLLSVLFLFWVYVIYDSIMHTDPDTGFELGKGVVNKGTVYKGGFNFAYAPGGRKGAIAAVLLGPHLSMALVGYASGEGAWHAPVKGCLYYLLTWMSAQLVVEFFKATSQRSRPVVALPYALSKVKRYLRQIGTGLTMARSRRASFPSGDVAGAMAFSACAFFITGATSSSYAWFVFSAMSAFGRMYFHAHHLLDVTIGAAISFATAAAVAKLSPSLLSEAAVPGGGWAAGTLPLGFLRVSTARVVLAVGQFVFLSTWFVLQKLKPKHSRRE